MKIVTVQFARLADSQHVKVGLEMGLQMARREDRDVVRRWYSVDGYLNLGIGSDMSEIVNPQGIITDAFLYFHEQTPQCFYFLREARALKKIKNIVYIVLQLRVRTQIAADEVPFKVRPVRNPYKREKTFAAGDGGQTQVWELSPGAHLEIRSGKHLWKVCNVDGVVHVSNLDSGQETVLLKEPKVRDVPSTVIQKGTVAKLANGGTGTQAFGETETFFVEDQPKIPQRPQSIDDLLDERDCCLRWLAEVRAKLQILGCESSRFEPREGDPRPDIKPEKSDI